jgi:hypothetical protein
VLLGVVGFSPWGEALPTLHSTQPTINFPPIPYSLFPIP